MDNKRIKVAITHGDTNGIGYELIFKAFNEPEMLEYCTPIIYGSPKVAAYYRKAMNLPAQFSIIQKAEDAEDGRINLLAAIEEEVKVDMGMPTPESGAAAVKALDRAMTDYRDGLYDVLVTAPVSSQNIKIEGYTFVDHKDYIETCLGDGSHALSLLVGDDLRIASVTGKTPLTQVAKSITQESIVEKTTLLWHTLKRDFLLTNPRIAVLALNPSINEEQSCGTEERNIIIPAIDALAEKGIQAFGPYPADEFFGNGYYNEFDGVMAMYHDQAAVPFHSLFNEDGVLYTAGLPIIHTAANTTPCYYMAGYNEADAISSATPSSWHSMPSAIVKPAKRLTRTRCQSSTTRNVTRARRFASPSQRSTCLPHSLQRAETSRTAPRETTSRMPLRETTATTMVATMVKPTTMVATTPLSLPSRLIKS